MSKIETVQKQSIIFKICFIKYFFIYLFIVRNMLREETKCNRAFFAIDCKKKKKSKQTNKQMTE